MTGDPQPLYIRIGDKQIQVGTARVTSIVPDEGEGKIARAGVELTIGLKTMTGEYFGGQWDIFAVHAEEKK